MLSKRLFEPWRRNLQAALGRTRRPHEAAPRCVAVLRFAAAGDVIRTAPAIEALQAAWPDARIVVVTHARCAPLLAGFRVPAEVLALPAGGSLSALARQLRQRGVTHVLDLHASLRARALCARLWPRPVVRWQKRTLAEYLRVRIGHAPHRPVATCAQRQQAAVRRLTGIDAPLPPLRLQPLLEGLGLSQNPSQEKRKVLPRESLAAPIKKPGPRRVGLSPGAAWASKRWPVDAWAALARALLSAGAQIEVYGSAAERERVDAVVAQAPGARPCVGLSWPELAAAMANLGAFVCGDSGPLHLAQALGVPSVGLFFSTSPQAFDNVASVVVAADLPCQPCSFYGRNDCPRGHFRCVTQVDTKRVVAAVQQLLQART